MRCESLNLDRELRRFTLLELLMVVTVFITLTVLLAPVIVAGSQRSLRVDCMSNQNRIGMALHGHANDHDGGFPVNRQQMPNLLAVSQPAPNSDVREALLDYVDATLLFYCPESPYYPPHPKQFASYRRDNKDWYFQSYIMLAGLPPHPFGPNVIYEPPYGDTYLPPMKQNASPDVVLLADFTASRPTAAAGTVDSPGFGYHRLQKDVDGSNLLFADGSVDWRDAGRLRPRLARRFRNDAGNTCYFFW